MVRCQLVLRYLTVTGKYLTIKTPTSVWKLDAHVSECPNKKGFQNDMNALLWWVVDHSIF